MMTFCNVLRVDKADAKSGNISNCAITREYASMSLETVSFKVLYVIVPNYLKVQISFDHVTLKAQSTHKTFLINKICGLQQKYFDWK